MLEPSQEDRAAVERLAGRVPWMLARAAALRKEAADPRVQLAVLAPRWLSAMAAVAAIVTLAALLRPSQAPKSASAAAAVDGWVMSGSVPQDDDPVLRELMR
jgi:hypothetical protein